MAGLNNLLSDTQQTQTTLPSWYDAAQQQIVQQGAAAFNAAPQLGQTVAQGAINQLQPGAQNPYTQAQQSLQQISSGAANPWIVDQSTGQVTPNTATPLGGLFQAENQQLNQLLPSTVAPTQAAGIGTGGFGGLRAQTAVDKAKADAFSTLNAQQLQTALSNQQVGQQAAANLGNVTNQAITSGMNVGMAQQNAPFQNVGNLASLIGTVQAPATVTEQKQLSPLSQVQSVGSAVQGGLNSLTGLAKTTAGKNILNSLGLGGLFGTSTNTNTNTNTNTGGGISNTGNSYNPDGSVNTSGSDVTTGYTQDSLGNVYLNGQLQSNINPNAGYTVDSQGQVLDQGGNVIQDPSIITAD
jgi:hypothetical protein